MNSLPRVDKALSKLLHSLPTKHRPDSFQYMVIPDSDGNPCLLVLVTLKAGKSPAPAEERWPIEATIEDAVHKAGWSSARIQWQTPPERDVIENDEGLRSRLVRIPSKPHARVA